MSMLVKVKVLFLSLLFLFVTSTAFAGTPLWPMQVGNSMEWQQHDSSSTPISWTTTLEIVGTSTIGGVDYFKAGLWNWDYPGTYGEVLVRSSDDAFYRRRGGNDILSSQIAPVGTTWSYRDTISGGETGWRVNEIISIESVSVPFGTFDNAYVNRSYFDFDDTNKPNSPYGYEYTVAGVGMVKRVNEWGDPSYTNPPNVQELVRVNVAPEPISSILFVTGGTLLAGRGYLRRKKKA